MLSACVTQLNPKLAVLAATDASLLALPGGDVGPLCARSVVSLAKWWAQEDRREALGVADGKAPPWMGEGGMQRLSWQYLIT